MDTGQRSSPDTGRCRPRWRLACGKLWPPQRVGGVLARVECERPAGVGEDALPGQGDAVRAAVGDVQLTGGIGLQIKQARVLPVDSAEKPGAVIAVPDGVAIAAGQVLATGESFRSCEQRQQALPLNRVGGALPGRTQNGGWHIQRVDQFIPYLTGSQTGGMAHEQGDVHGAGVHMVGGLADHFFHIVAEICAVIAEEEDQCIFAHSQAVDGLQQAAKPSVNHRDQPGIVGADAGDAVGVVIGARPIGGGQADRLAVGAAAIEIVVVQGRFPKSREG